MRLLGRILLVLAVTGGTFAATVWFTRPAGTDLDTVLHRDDDQTASATTTTSSGETSVTSVPETTGTTSPGDESATTLDPVDRQLSFDPPGDWFVALDDRTNPSAAIDRLRRFGDTEMADRILTAVEQENEEENERRGDLVALWANATTREVIALSTIAAWDTTLEDVSQAIADEDWPGVEAQRSEVSGAETWLIEPGEPEPVTLVTRTNHVTVWVMEFPASASSVVVGGLQLEVLVDAPRH